MAKNTTAQEPPKPEKVCGIVMKRSAEIKVLQFGIGKIFFRLPSTGEMSRFRSECRADARGFMVDPDLLAQKVLSSCITKWENVLDENGNECPLTPENIADLPDEVAGKIAQAMFDFVRPENAALPLEISPATSK
jgi:hypothetical protein